MMVVRRPIKAIGASNSVAEGKMVGSAQYLRAKRGAGVEQEVSKQTLGDYLRTRRLQAAPPVSVEDTASLRRVAGLRREEVARAAGVSVGYYIRLEQGRSSNPSPQVLGALSRALDLSDVEARYLNALAAARPPKASNERGGSQAELESMRKVVASYSDRPIVIVSPSRFVEAATPVAQRLDASFTPGRNVLVEHFLNPDVRRRLVHWEGIAHGAVGAARMSLAQDPTDHELRQLTEHLRAQSPDFAALWKTQHVEQQAMGRTGIRHETAGLLELDYTRLASVRAPGYTLLMFSAHPGSGDAARLNDLSG